MEDEHFEWDDGKALENYAKHGVSFQAATRIFRDPFAIERVDDREDYGEERFAITGIVDGRVLVVVYTLRNGKMRLISARGAEPHERRQYHEDNS
jgi:uncharacterized DUF497 family protein